MISLHRANRSVSFRLSCGIVLWCVKSNKHNFFLQVYEETKKGAGWAGTDSELS